MTVETTEYNQQYIQQEIEEKAASVIRAIPAKQIIPIFKANKQTDEIPIHIKEFESDTGILVKGFNVNIETWKAIELWYSTD